MYSLQYSMIMRLAFFALGSSPKNHWDFFSFVGYISHEWKISVSVTQFIRDFCALNSKSIPMWVQFHIVNRKGSSLRELFFFFKFHSNIFTKWTICGSILCWVYAHAYSRVVLLQWVRSRTDILYSRSYHVLLSNKKSLIVFSGDVPGMQIR